MATNYYTPYEGPDYNAAAADVAKMSDYFGQSQAVSDRSSVAQANLFSTGASSLANYNLESRKIDLLEEESQRAGIRSDMEIRLKAQETEASTRREEMRFALELQKSTLDLAKMQHDLASTNLQTRFNLSKMKQDLSDRQRLTEGQEAFDAVSPMFVDAESRASTSDFGGALALAKQIRETPNFNKSAAAVAKYETLFHTITNAEAGIDIRSGSAVTFGEVIKAMGGDWSNASTLSAAQMFINRSGGSVEDTVKSIGSLLGLDETKDAVKLAGIKTLAQNTTFSLSSADGARFRQLQVEADTKRHEFEKVMGPEAASAKSRGWLRNQAALEFGPENSPLRSLNYPGSYMDTLTEHVAGLSKKLSPAGESFGQVADAALIRARAARGEVVSSNTDYNKPGTEKDAFWDFNDMSQGAQNIKRLEALATQDPRLKVLLMSPAELKTELDKNPQAVKQADLALAKYTQGNEDSWLARRANQFFGTAVGVSRAKESENTIALNLAKNNVNAALALLSDPNTAQRSNMLQLNKAVADFNMAAQTSLPAGTPFTALRARDLLDQQYHSELSQIWFLRDGNDSWLYEQSSVAPQQVTEVQGNIATVPASTVRVDQ